MSAPTRLTGVLQEDVPGSGESVLVHPDTGRILALNPSGAAVWDLLDGQRDLDHLAGVLAEAAGIPLPDARADVHNLLEQLRAEGFLAQA